MFGYLTLRDNEREKRFRRAMVIRGQGVPAEGEPWIRMIPWIRLLLGIPFSIFLGLICIGLVPAWIWGGGAALSDFRLTALGVFVAGFLVNWVGHRMLQPREGEILASTPARDILVWRHNFWSLPRILLGLWAGILIVYLFRDSDALTTNTFGGLLVDSLLKSTAWILLPLFGVAWQFFRRGGAGSAMLSTGILFGVALLLAPLLSLFIKPGSSLESWNFEAIRKLLPVSWLSEGPVGWILFSLGSAWIAMQWRNARACFRLRDTWSAVMAAPVISHAEPRASAPHAAPLQATSQQERPRVLGNFPDRFFSLLWTQEEKAVARALGFRVPVKSIAKPFLALLLLPVLGWLAEFSTLSERYPEFVLPLTLTVLGVIWLLLLRGWQSRVIACAFQKFSGGGPRRVMAMGALPIAEPQMFWMYWKEFLLSRVLVIPVQVLVLLLAAKVLNAQLQAREGFVIFVMLGPALFLNSLTTWAGLLWQGIELFPDTLLGIIKSFATKFAYSIPLIALVILSFWTGGEWLYGDHSATGFVLSASFLTAWCFGACWLMRRVYAQGKGSLMVVPPKRKSFTITLK